MSWFWKRYDVLKVMVTLSVEFRIFWRIISSVLPFMVFINVDCLLGIVSRKCLKIFKFSDDRKRNQRTLRIYGRLRGLPFSTACRIPIFWLFPHPVSQDGPLKLTIDCVWKRHPAIGNQFKDDIARSSTRSFEHVLTLVHCITWMALFRCDIS